MDILMDICLPEWISNGMPNKPAYAVLAVPLMLPLTPLG